MWIDAFGDDTSQTGHGKNPAAKKLGILQRVAGYPFDEGKESNYRPTSQTNLRPATKTMHKHLLIVETAVLRYLALRRASHLVWALCAWMIATPRVAAQNFNVDFGDARGTPTSTYGAAAGQVGAWTTIAVTGSAVALKNLDGTASTGQVTLSAQYPGGTATTRTGDQAALLDDNFFSDQPASWSVVISGLANGRYSLYYYAPANSLVDTGAFTANGVAAANLTGSSSGLTRGVDWQVLSGLMVSDGTLTLSETNYPGEIGLAGLQLVGVVPEPSAWVMLSFGAVGAGIVVLHRRRHAF